ncbi:hypothetical protein [Pseudomonas tohonis]|uniref:hypothetical protein n=1 Tax=Pseudomonas tohonis TaxID=2725477 RepID=UPI00255BD798|nr:hypothetical protein [Pseudomonas tohonis]
MRFAGLSVLVALSGCTSDEPRVAGLVEVKMPVMVACTVTLPAVPAFVVDSLALDAPIDQQMKVLRAERLQRIGYERELLAALKACR